MKPFEIKQLTENDLSTFTSLIDLFNTVFEEEHPSIGSTTNSLKLLNNKNFIALVALAGDMVAGGLTAYELPKYYSDSSEMFIYDLLIQSLKEYCIEHGIKELFVMAHEEDTHAIEFYRSTGGKSEKVVNFIYEAI